MSTLSRKALPFLIPYVVFAAILSCHKDDGGFGPNGNKHYDSGVPVDPGDSTPNDTSAETGVETGTPDTSGETAQETADTAAPFEGTGYAMGDTAFNLVASTQTGADWRLYQHTSGPVVLVFGYAQSAVFQAMCTWLPGLATRYADEGVTIATVLLLDQYGYTADQSDASLLASTYSLSTVLWDSEDTIAGTWASTTQVKTYLIDADMQIVWSNLESTAEEQLDDKISALVY